MSTALKCAVYGTGHSHMAGKLAELEHVEEWEVAGVCEPDPDRLATIKSQANAANWTWIGEDQALEDTSIQMLAIESDVPRLMTLAGRAVDAGKHIHLDKPPGVRLEPLRQLQNQALAKDLIIQMGYMFRYNEGFKLVQRAVREGWLGRVHHVHIAMVAAFDQGGRDRCSYHPGGIMVEFGCHLFDQVVMLMGRPKQVTPILRNDGDQNDGFIDHALAILDYEHALAVVETSALEGQGFPRRFFEVAGSNGSIIVQPMEPPAVRLRLQKPAGGYEAGVHEIEVQHPPRYQADLIEFARCIRGEQVFPYTPEHDLLAQETLLRACGVKP